MKISKLYRKRVKSTSKVVNTNNTPLKSSPIRHEFNVLSADEINNNRSKAYQYLVF